MSLEVTFSHPAFDAVRPFVERIQAHGHFPTVAELDLLLRDRLSLYEPVALETQPPKRRRRGRRSRPRDSLYEGRIHVHRRVPTREENLHDLANALIWGAFPLAKRALVARQYHALAARVPELVDALPPTRTREQDALTMLDEGGLILLASTDCEDEVRSALREEDVDTLRRWRRRGALSVLVFGHALLEHVALHSTDVRAFGMAVPRSAADGDELACADRALAAWIEAKREGEAGGLSLRALLEG